MRKSSVIPIVLLMLNLATVAHCGPKVFDFKDPKGVNAIAIQVDSLLEPITGFASGISGMLTFAADKPEATRGTLTVQAASIAMSNPVMTQHLHSEDWLDVEKNPVIEYKITGVKAAEKKGESSWMLTTTGDFTLHGVTKPEEVSIGVTFLPGKAAERNHAGSGDLLVLRSAFDVDRTKYGIKPGMPPISVGRDIHLKVGIVGTSTSE